MSAAAETVKSYCNQASQPTEVRQREWKLSYFPFKAMQ
uniref:Uncharacterized protein n=1 Tax=Anguilla anguilla TaxID=7936 RepID=A0A0E9U122_ANGAN